MNITKIERYVRVLALPAFCVGGGLLLIVIGVMTKDALVLANVSRYLAFGGLFVAAAGGLWILWSLIQMERWENGADVGSCPKCGGIELNLDGRYGPYSRCKMCGAKREGW